jgi:hypothetical protein
LRRGVKMASLAEIQTISRTSLRREHTAPPELYRNT